MKIGDEGQINFSILIGDEGLLIGIVAQPRRWQAYLSGTDIDNRREIRAKIKEALEKGEKLFQVDLHSNKLHKDYLAGTYSEEEIAEMLEIHKGNISAIARKLNIAYWMVRDYIHRHNLDYRAAKGGR